MKCAYLREGKKHCLNIHILKGKKNLPYDAGKKRDLEILKKSVWCDERWIVFIERYSINHWWLPAA